MKKTIVLRCVLGVLILLNLFAIFGFSSQSADASGKTSEKVIRPVASVVVKDFENKPPEEQNTIVSKLQLPIRKLAHMTEFGCLGVLVMLLLRTFRLSNRLAFLLAVLDVLVCASADELNQLLAQAGRCGQITDVLIDCAGAVIGCLLLYGILTLHTHLQKRKRKSE